MIVGKKITGFFELVKPLVEFKFEIIQSRGNNVFELATQEEIDKLGSTTKGSSSKGQFTDDIDLDEVKLISSYFTTYSIVLIFLFIFNPPNYFNMI